MPHLKIRVKTYYVLTEQDGDRIDHLLGVLATAISELLISKRVKVPETPKSLPAEDQLMNEVYDITGPAFKAGFYSGDDF